MELIISPYLTQIENDNNHRFTSWENCYKAFQTINNIDFLSLHLAFYLASWGMYRGSSGLLQKNHKIHVKAVEIILKYRSLQCNPMFEISTLEFDDLCKLIEELIDYYGSIKFWRNNKNDNVSPTITLITKIIMGTLGCLPAFDRYFLDGINFKKQSASKISQTNFEFLLEFINKTKSEEITNIQKAINSKRDMYYPKMKIVDMYFWQTGYAKRITEKDKKASKS
jgi:hypothetical protein